MSNTLEEYATGLTKLGQHVRQFLRGQPPSKTLLAAALQLMFECPNSILRGPLCIRSDYIVARRKCMDPLRQVGGPQYEEYAGVWFRSQLIQGTPRPVCASCVQPFGPVHFSTLHTQTGRTGLYNCRKPFGPVHFSTLHTKTGRTGLANCRKPLGLLHLGPFYSISPQRRS